MSSWIGLLTASKGDEAALDEWIQYSDREHHHFGNLIVGPLLAQKARNVDRLSDDELAEEVGKWLFYCGRTHNRIAGPYVLALLREKEKRLEEYEAIKERFYTRANRWLAVGTRQLPDHIHQRGDSFFARVETSTPEEDTAQALLARGSRRELTRLVVEEPTRLERRLFEREERYCASDQVSQRVARYEARTLKGEQRTVIDDLEDKLKEKPTPPRLGVLPLTHMAVAIRALEAGERDFGLRSLAIAGVLQEKEFPSYVDSLSQYAADLLSTINKAVDYIRGRARDAKHEAQVIIRHPANRTTAANYVRERAGHASQHTWYAQRCARSAGSLLAVVEEVTASVAENVAKRGAYTRKELRRAEYAVGRMQQYARDIIRRAQMTEQMFVEITEVPLTADTLRELEEEAKTQQAVGYSALAAGNPFGLVSLASASLYLETRATVERLITQREQHAS